MGLDLFAKWCCCFSFGQSSLVPSIVSWSQNNRTTDKIFVVSINCFEEFDRRTSKMLFFEKNVKTAIVSLFERKCLPFSFSSHYPKFWVLLFRRISPNSNFLEFWSCWALTDVFEAEIDENVDRIDMFFILYDKDKYITRIMMLIWKSLYNKFKIN